jgi:putative spermidine/putrescine transport system substrate-binding protein
MKEQQTFAQDCVEIACEELRAGRLSRRDFALALAALGIGGPAFAQGTPKEIVLVNWGGDAVKAFTEAFVEPYQKKTGGKMVIDGSGPTNGKMKAMVQAKNVTWDICDSGVAGLGELAPLGMLEKIDYTVVDKKKCLADFAYEYGVVNYMFSTVMCWDSSKIKEKPTLADFFDVKKYPGKRMLRKNHQAMMEMALMADGVPIDKVYPVDIKRAFAKIASIKKDALYWNTGAESQSLLRDGECVMGWLWHTRANLLKRDTNGKLDWTYDGGVLQPGLWVVPKGNPAGKQAMVAIASMQEPEGQVKLLGSMGNGPANPAASALVPADLRPVDPGSPENAAKQVRISADWYEKNGAKALQDYLDLISS